MSRWIRSDDKAAPQAAREIIRSGGLIIVPTDTVYGIAADMWQENAVRGLYKAKQRPPDKAIPVLLSDTGFLMDIAEQVPASAQILAQTFWPGPLTIIVPRRAEIPEIVSAYDTIGVRIPAHEDTRAVIRACGGALAVTSANLSGEEAPITAEQAAQSLGDSIGLVIDGGTCPGGSASTVVDTSKDTVAIIRQGPISEAMVLEALAQYRRQGNTSPPFR